MRLDQLTRDSWETLGWLSIDGATCGFGDAETLGADFELDGRKPGPGPWRVEDYTFTGIPLLCLSTMGDQDVPVEVARQAGGEIYAARMCLTNDVDDVEGEWLPAGELEIKSGKCVALDPSCSPEPPYRLQFDVVPGVYLAQVFKFLDADGDADILAIRIGLL